MPAHLDPLPVWGRSCLSHLLKRFGMLRVLGFGPGLKTAEHELGIHAPKVLRSATSPSQSPRPQTRPPKARDFKPPKFLEPKRWRSKPNALKPPSAGA